MLPFLRTFFQIDWGARQEIEDLSFFFYWYDNNDFHWLLESNRETETDGAVQAQVAQARIKVRWKKFSIPKARRKIKIKLLTDHKHK